MSCLPATLSVHNDTSEETASTGIKHLQLSVCDRKHWHDKFVDVKRGMRILKYFKVAIRLQKTNCFSGGLLMFLKRRAKAPPKLCVSMWLHILRPHLNLFSESSCSS